MGLGRWQWVVSSLVVVLGAQLAGGHPTAQTVDRDNSPTAWAPPPSSPSNALISGFENLSPRLRMPQPTAAALPAVEVPPAEPPPPDAPPVDAPIAPPPERFSEPPEPPAPEPVVLRASSNNAAPRSSGTWAVMIGINNYPGSEYDLQYAVNDANEVNRALAGFGVAAERRLLLLDNQAGLGSIRRSVEWLNANAGPDATVVFFYAGHVRKAGSNEAIVGADGGMLRDVELAAMLDELQAAKVWIGIAACYGGGFTEVMKPGRVLVAAAAANELAYENVSFGRSYLVEYMVRRAMIDSGITTVEGSFAAAREGLRKDFPDRLPVLFDQHPGALDLKVAPSRTSSPPPPSGGGSPPPPPPNNGCDGVISGIFGCKQR